MQMSPIVQPCHHPACSRLIMDPPDGKWSYLAKPVDAEAATLLTEHFPSIPKNLVSKPAGLPLVQLSVSMFGTGFFGSAEMGKRLTCNWFFRRNTPWVSNCFVLSERAERSWTMAAISEWQDRQRINVGLSCVKTFTISINTCLKPKLVACHYSQAFHLATVMKSRE